MTDDLTVRSIPIDSWGECIRRFRDMNYQQMYPYAEALAASRGAGVEAIGVYAADEDLPVGATLVRLRRAPLLPFGVAMIVAGPATRQDGADDLRRFEGCVGALCDELVRRRGLVLRIAAPVGGQKWNEGCVAAFERLGLRPAQDGSAYRTMLIDVRRPLEDIEASLSHYWRRNLRRSGRETLHVSFDQSPAAFDPIVRLHDELLQRKDFDVNLDASFYASLQPSLEDADALTVAQCRDDAGEVLSSIVLSELGDTTVGIVGATSSRGSKIYASYRLFWSIIERTHERGARWFDLGGIDPSGNPGVHKFKSGMRGDDVTGAGPHQIAPNRVLNAIATELWKRAATRPRKKGALR